MANPYVAGPLYKGGADLMGALVSGGDVEEAARGKAYDALLGTQTREATLDSKITQALLQRDKRKAQQETEQNLVGMGAPPALAKAAADGEIGGLFNIEQAQKFGLRQQLPGAFEAEGISPANAIAGALQGKPIPKVTFGGGNQIVGALTGNPVVTPTDATAAAIAARQLTSGAQARLSNVKADAGGWNPSTGGHRRKGTQMENARAILDAVGVNDPGAAMGYSPRDVKEIQAAGLDFTPLRAARPGEMRFITPDGVSNVPMRKDGKVVVADNVGNVTTQRASERARGNQPAVIDVNKSKPRRINSKGERDALPSGTRYIAPDGSIKIKK